MNKFRLYITVMALSLLGACSVNDDFVNSNDPILKDRTVTIKATVDNTAELTRAGIVEGNTDYENGELFYWEEGDKIGLYFVKDGNVEGSATFEANNVNENSADFIGEVPQGLSDGLYTVYAAKDLVESDLQNLKKVQNQIQTQKSGSTSGIELPMLSLPVKEVVISDGVVLDESSLAFSLKQLNSLLRFSFVNSASQALTVEKITVRIEDSDGNPVNSFAGEATVALDGSTDVKWNFVSAPTLDQLTLIIEQDEIAVIAEDNTFDAYLSLLPSEGFAVDNNFVVEVSLKGADGNNYLQTKQMTISNSGDFSFLSTGLEAGSRYYFISELRDDNIEKKRMSYTITFEEEYYDDFVVHKNYPGVTSSTEWAGWSGNRYPDWIDPVTQLSVTRRPEMVGAGTMEGYPWIVSAYNSNSLDTDTHGYYTHDLYVYNPDGEEDSTTGGGNNGSDNFITTFGYMDPEYPDYGDGRPILSFEDKKPRTIKGLYVNSTNYFISVALQGNPLSPPLGENEDVVLIATGYDADDNEISNTEMVFASYERAVTEWTYWGLSSLGDIVMLKINMVGGPDNGYGFSLPACYAVDDVTIEWDE